MTKQNVLFFVLLYLAVSIFSIGISMLVYQMALREETVKTRVSEKIYVSSQMETQHHVIDDITSDLLYLADQQGLKSFLSTGRKADKTHIETEYCSFAKRKGRYDQIRLLDTAGKEIIRVNCRDKKTKMVPESELQDKSSRYYFKASLAGKGIYISKMDLNIEHKKIERPFKPVIRFGLAARDLEGDKKGVLLLNYLGSHLTEMMTRKSAISAGDLMIINPSGYWLYGPVPEDLWGFMIQERAQARFQNRFPEIWPEIQKNSTGQIMAAGGLFTWETLVLESQDEWFWKVVSLVPERALASSVRHFGKKLSGYHMLIQILLLIPVFFFTRNIHRRRQLQEALIQSANFDSLTGLANRAMFYTMLEQAILNAKRYNDPFALFFIDIDGFKMVNDTLGHHMGDKLLIAIAGRLKKCVRESDLVARLGGDEFTLLINRISGTSDIKEMAKKLIKSLSTPFEIDGDTIKVGASIGISAFPANGSTADMLVRKADQEMYKCKRQGKNCYSLCDSEEINELA